MITADRVKETSTTTGTGSVTLAGAALGYRTFNTAFGVGPTLYYCIARGAEWEVGIGTLSSPTLLARTTVLSSSNANALVSFTGGTKDVFATGAAVTLNANLGAYTWAGLQVEYPNGGAALAALPANAMAFVSTFGCLMAPNAAKTRWRPLSGEFVLRQDSGSLSSPLASLTGATSGNLPIPGGNVSIPADLCAADWAIFAFFKARKTGTNDVAALLLRLGTADSVSDGIVSTAICENTNGRPLDNNAEIYFQSSTRVLCAGVRSAGLADLAAMPDPTDQTTNVDSAIAMTLGAYVFSQSAADTVELLSYSVKICAPQ